MPEQSQAEFQVRRVQNDEILLHSPDFLAIEEPLEIRLGSWANGKSTHRAVSITMRTPCNDFELAAGFLFTEGIIKSAAEISHIKHCGAKLNRANTVRVDLRETVAVDLKRLERHFYTTSSCGVCGKTSIEALQTGAEKIADKINPIFAAATIHNLPETLRTKQNIFDSTGGLHAAALFDWSGKLEAVFEDVGRHNAVDKLIGAKFLANELPLTGKLLFVSGRASFELVQKALMANIPILAAVGAPSSLAVETARTFGMTLLGFVRDKRFNIYSNPQRIK